MNSVLGSELRKLCQYSMHPIWSAGILPASVRPELVEEQLSFDPPTKLT